MNDFPRKNKTSSLLPGNSAFGKPKSKIMQVDGFISRGTFWYDSFGSLEIHMDRKFTYKIHLKREPEGGFTVTVPSLPGCVTWGKDYNHALEKAREAIEGFLETLMDLGKPIPEEPAQIPVDALVEVTSPGHT